MSARIKPLVLVVLMVSCSSYSSNILAKKGEYLFDPSLIGGGDVSRFNDGQQLPGTYLVTVAINDLRKKVGNYKVEFDYSGDKLLPLLKKEDLLLFNIEPEKIRIVCQENNDFIDFERSEIKANFSFFGMSLTLYVPPDSLKNKISELSPESQWDDGINALLLNYDGKVFHRNVQSSSSSAESYYLDLKPGINIGSWRLRNSGIWQKGYDGESTYQHSYAYAERDIRPLKSKFLIGESATNSDVFGGLPFKGIRFSTSDDMIPFFERTFTPPVRGVAQSVAQVEVRQNGYLIYSTEVPAGPFELTDIPASEGEDLDVTVTEDNGSELRFTVPYNVPAISLKKGRAKYELVLGEYRPYSNKIRDDNFGQLTLIYGINDVLTGYTGFLASNNYWSGALGLGFNLYDYGAISVDGIYSRNGFSNDKSGSAVRLRYNNLLNETGTSFNLASYQYASDGYYTFSDAMESGSGYYDIWKKKNDSSVSVRQELFDYGTLDLSLNKTTYWNKESESYINLNYNTSLFKKTTFSIGWNRVITSDSREEEDVFSATISMPLGWFTGSGTYTHLRYNVLNELDDSISNSLSLNGTAYENRLTWTLSQGTNSKNHHNNRTSVSGAFKNSFGTFKAMYNYSPSVIQYGGGFNGSAVIHNQGVTFGQVINGAAALIDVNGSDGINVLNKPGVRTDGKGFALVTSLNTYRKNDIHIQQADLNSKTEIKQTSVSVTPTSNALVLAKYESVVGEKSLFRLRDPDNKPIPFGAIVSVDGQNSTGIIGDDGEVYLSGLRDRGVLKVRWGNNSSMACKADYILSIQNSAGIYSASLKCQ